MTPLYISSIGGYCPCQATGAIYGNPFYFRARHGEWTIEIARPGEDPIGNPSLFYLAGDDPDNGYMDNPQALYFIGTAFDAFTKQYANQIYSGADYPPSGVMPVCGSAGEVPNATANREPGT